MGGCVAGGCSIIGGGVSGGGGVPTNILKNGPYLKTSSAGCSGEPPCTKWEKSGSPATYPARRMTLKILKFVIMVVLFRCFVDFSRECTGMPIDKRHKIDSRAKSGGFRHGLRA